MMGKAAILDMTGKKLQEPKGKSKTTKQSLEWLEERPRPEWFVKIKSPSGRVQWFVRFSMTGLETRRYGPFAGKPQCLEFIDAALESLWYDGRAELESLQVKHCMKSCQFESSHNEAYPILEHALALHAKHLSPRKGR